MSPLCMEGNVDVDLCRKTLTTSLNYLRISRGVAVMMMSIRNKGDILQFSICATRARLMMLYIVCIGYPNLLRSTQEKKTKQKWTFRGDRAISSVWCEDVSTSKIYDITKRLFTMNIEPGTLYALRGKARLSEVITPRLLKTNAKWHVKAGCYHHWHKHACF